MSRRRRGLLWVGLLAVLTGSGVVIVKQSCPQQPTLLERLKQVNHRMPKEDVLTVFGSPSRLHAGSGMFWTTDSEEVFVMFDDAEKVRSCYHTKLPPASLLTRLRRLLGL